MAGDKIFIIMKEGKTMSNEVVGEIVGCDSLYFAKVLEDSLDAYRAEVPKYLAPLGEVKHDAKASSTSSAYDNSNMFTYYSEAGEDTLSVSGLSEIRKAELTGKSVDPVTGRVFDSGDLSNVPYYAVGYRISIGNGDYIYRWFLKGTFALGSEDAKSKGDKVDAQGIDLTFTPVSTVHKWQIPDPRDSAKTILAPQKKVSDDTTNPAFSDADTWFTQVQTPSASGPLPALIVTVSPTSGAADVAVGTVPTLTFSNAIADYSGVVLMADGAAIACTAALDNTKKVLTLTPATALSAGKQYSIIIAAVQDIYGQSLETTVSNFTTATV